MADVLPLPRTDYEERSTARSTAIDKMAAARQPPRSISRRELVPEDIRRHYDWRWQAEEREDVLAIAAAMAASTQAPPIRKGRLARAIEALFGRL